MNRTKRHLLLVGLLIAAFTFPAKSAQAFKVGIHEALTADALSFLNSAILADINGEHLYQDTAHALDSSHHFDNCEFQEATDYINQQYTRPNGFGGDGGVLAEMDPSDPQPFDATDEFGQLLHTAEDFYAHSNWVELGRTDLLDNGLGLRAALSPWNVLRDDIVVAEGEDLPSGWSASSSPNPKTPTLTTNTGEVKRGLISGTFGPSDECYDPIAVAHGSDDPDHLNKDDSSRPGFAEARGLAVRQVQHEWCRMLHLLTTTYGYAGASIPMGLWVDPGGDPHPAGTPCARQVHTGEHNVTVSLNRVNVRNDTDPFGSGEINLNLVLYTGDFRDSQRIHVGALDISSGDDVDGNVLSGMTLTLSCLADTDTAVSTLQGWDDDGGTDGLFDDEDADPDDVLKGLTVTSSGSELGARQINATSDDLDATFTINTSASPDTDNDGLSTCREQQLGTNPTDPDTDHDGVNDGSEVNSYHTDPTKPDPFVDLVLTQSAAPNPAAVGTKLVYTVGVTNSGPHAASKIQLTDPLPPGLTYLDSSAECVLDAARNLTCMLSELASGATQQIDIAVIPEPSLLASGTSATVTNSVSIHDQAGIELDATNNSATVAVDVTSNRVFNGIQVLYTFNENHGAIVHDVSGNQPALDLTVSNEAATQWTSDGLLITTSTVLASGTPASQLINAISTTKELTLEAWIIPASVAQQPGADVVALAQDRAHADVALAQVSEGRYKTWLRIHTSTLAGDSSAQTAKHSITSMLQHVAYTRDASGLARIYVNGVLQGRATHKGNLGAWDSTYQLSLGNTVAGDGPWLGTYRFAAVYNRALSPAEIKQNFQAGPTGANGTPLYLGVEARYTFKEGSGTTIHDVANVGPPLDLQISDSANTNWTPTGLQVISSTMITSNVPATKIIDGARSSDELTLEAWITPSDVYREGIGRIVTVSARPPKRDFALSQQREDGQKPYYRMRIRTTASDDSGNNPPLFTPEGSLTGTLQHVVVTRDADGVTRLYINGIERRHGTTHGSFATWDTSYQLGLANDFTGEPSWRGEYQLVALYNRALSPAEVSRQFHAGPTITDASK